MEKTLKIRTSDLKWIIMFSIIVAILTSIPYFLGYIAETSEWQFSGFLFGVEDGYSYIAKMVRGASGDWLFRTPYTAYPQNGGFAFFPYILLGKLAAGNALHTQLVMIFHWFRIGGIFFLVYATYYFSLIFLQEEKSVRIAVILSILGGGAGWIMPLLGNKFSSGHFPLEWYSPETFGFLEVFGLPHLSFSRGLMLIALTLFIKALETKNHQKSIFAGIALLISGVFQPINTAIGGLVGGIWFLVSITRNKFTMFKKAIISNLAFFIIPVPLVLYYAISFQKDIYFSQWNEQNIITSPGFVDYIFAYGIPFLLVLIVLLLNRKQFSLRAFYYSNSSLLIIWILVAPFLIYSPFNIQRRLAEGVWVAISILLVFVMEKIKNKRISIGLLPFFFISTIIFFIASLNTAMERQPPVFIETNQVELFELISDVAQKDDIVLADYSLSTAMPAWFPIKVVWGHGPESIHKEIVEEYVLNFYNCDATQTELEKMVDTYAIDFLILDQRDFCLLPILRETFKIKVDYSIANYHLVELDFE